MFVALSSRTQAGIERIAAERRRALGLPEPRRKTQNASRQRYEALKAIPGLDTVRGRIAYIAWWHRVTYANIVGKVVNEKICAARYDAIANIRLFKPDWSLTQLGRPFGREHSTIIHALSKRGLR